MFVNVLNKYQLDFVSFVDKKVFHLNTFHFDLIDQFFSNRKINIRLFMKMKNWIFT
jgi:hypothetical protein